MPDIGTESIRKFQADTLPKLLLENYKRNPYRVAMRRKDLGIYNPYTWEDCYLNTKYFALGLKELGFGSEDKMAILGDNEPEWYWAELAAQALGGICVGLFVDVIPSEVQYIVDQSDSTFAVIKDQEQCDKFFEVIENLPKLKKIIYWDPKGMRGYRGNPMITPFNEVVELGKQFEEKSPGTLEESISKGKGTNIATICYTSGTTGLPKGVLISHDYIIKAGRKFYQKDPWKPTDDHLSFAPLAWIAEQYNMMGSLIYGMCVNYPESPDTVQENMREIGPQSVLLGPRQWQGLFSMVQMKMNDATFFKKWLYQLSMAIGHRVVDYRYKQRKSVPLLWSLLYKLAQWTCLMHIRDHLGLRRTRWAMTGGASLGPDVFWWFQATGVNLKEAYALTEVQTVASHGDWPKAGTVGLLFPGSQVKFTDDGEILAKTDVMFSGYYKQPEETAKRLQNGWFKTGDCGTFDEDGHLVIFDRIVDMLELKGGEKYSPTYIENRFKYSPYIRDAMVVGGKDREFIFAIVNIDFDNVGRWAEKNGFPYTTFVDLSQKKEVYDLIQKHVETVNKVLPQGARVRKFSLLHKEFDPDEGELTKTRKLRRSFMKERYKAIIEAAYSNLPSVTTKAEVKYRDGRTATVETAIMIHDLG